MRSVRSYRPGPSRAASACAQFSTIVGCTPFTEGSSMSSRFPSRATLSGAANGYHPDLPALITGDLPLRGNREFASAYHKRYRPVLDNPKLKERFGYVPRYSSRAAFLAWRDRAAIS